MAPSDCETSAAEWRKKKNMELDLQLTDLDRRIWAEELDGFVPQRIFDVHTHMYCWEFNTDPAREESRWWALFGRRYPRSDLAALRACDAALMPGRTLQRLSFPFPFWPGCDFHASNRHVAEEAAADRGSAALMLVHPGMGEEELESRIAGRAFAGFKPYRFYSTTRDPVDCRITDFLPEHQIRVADRHGLLIMLHLARREGLADPQNTGDLQRLTRTYPRVKWILAHCGRGYAAWMIERAGSRLRELETVWYDTSSVCESDAIEALCRGVGPDRVMYGSDDLPVGLLRGKYITFGRAWAFLSEQNHTLDLSHCDPRMTFTRYEQLRAMRAAALRLGLDQGQIEDLFCNTALRLVQSAWN